ncbi:AMP-binding protein [Altererythrobacter arenosus]|uniref:AMP-binding protein n=1 Tax=Altererythrobacter arenosus TaxID=3032592 RepID=A0ABY8FZE7_9SPHN|nr:AMP-binding protein [Altererythrobacter sp. CAU 1644]WFL78766.1 AMP-binding protein [Altererythrobacter sp. CAU 1644]
MTWQGENFGFAIKALAQAIEPERPALVHGDRVIAWGEFDRLTDSIAAGLLERGLKQGDVAGQMQRNSPEYLLAFFGALKAGVTPVNVNYRYKERELADIFARFGLSALFVDAEFAGIAAGAMPDGALDPLVAEPGQAEWDSLLGAPLPEGFEVCADRSVTFFMATGGTTGMPKAVMWPCADFWQSNGVSTFARDLTVEPFVAASLSEHVAAAARLVPEHPDTQAPMLLLCPLMHGTAQYSAIAHLLRGGTVVTIPGANFDADIAIDTIRDHRVRTTVIVGDAHAIPLLAALEARADAKEAIATLHQLGSSGALFSGPLKERFIAINQGLMILDVLGSSESGGGTAVRLTTKDGTTGGGDFTIVPDRAITLFDEDLVEIPPGSDKIGIVARGGALPLGYLGEDAKNAETFPTINGKRYLLTGDRARWGADGSIEFIGRDNMCINTGGEKVFPEEVEEVLMEHRGVHDARIVSTPDPRFGRKVVAVVQPKPDAGDLERDLDGYVRDRLADYKVPRAYVFTQDSLRLNNGKPDYKAAQAIADASLT